ncbi:MAG: sulfatase-like hydrolase/transferase [Acidobacteriota bacterium]
MRRCIPILALILLVSCRSPERKAAPAARLRPFNVVLVTIDTLRADRLGCYGNANVATPNLDALARRGVVFENGLAQAPLTAPSHASMMTGLYPTAHKVRDTGGFVLSPAHASLAATLQQQGWDTAAFVGASVLKKRFGFDRGFAVYDDEFGSSSESIEGTRERRAGEVVDRALAWLGGQAGKPYLLWVHVYDPHMPYESPSPFREKYKGRPYDGEVAYTDRELGRLFDAVAKKDPAGNTLVAVLSDHGESFSEHGEYAHGVFLYDTTLRIAFLLSGPGVPAGLRVRQQARTIDLFPTLLELMGGKAPAAVEGASLVPAFTGKPAPEWSYIETLFPKINMGWTELRGVRTNRWKYIRAPKPELYDLAQDPGETTNVIASHPAEFRDLESKLKTVAGRDTEKVEAAPLDQRTMSELKSLGYLSGSGQYELTGKGADPKDRTAVLKLLHFAVYADNKAPLAARIDMLKRAIAQDAANPTLYASLGDLYRGAGRNADEMTLYRDAVNRGVRTAWLFSRLGALYLRQGNKAEAVTFLEAARQLNASDYESLQNLAVAYRETGRVADAERVLHEIVATEDQYAPAYNELGMAAYQRGDMAAARGYFEKAARLNPLYQLNLGRLYKMMGDTVQARASFEAFLAAKSSTPEYRRMLPQARAELAQLR